MEKVMQVHFMKWSMDINGRTGISINPTEVVRTEYFSDAYTLGNDAMPPATSIFLKKGKSYIVQGHIGDVIKALNEAESKMFVTNLLTAVNNERK
jgi:uncharacterized protein YlzI (FlbEa/FlbD family)